MYEKRGVRQVAAGHLVFLGQSRDIVLEGVGHPAVLDPHIADALQGVPETIPRPHCCVQELVKVLVVAKDHMATHVKEEALRSDVSARKTSGFIRLCDSPVDVACHHEKMTRNVIVLLYM